VDEQRGERQNQTRGSERPEKKKKDSIGIKYIVEKQLGSEHSAAKGVLRELLLPTNA
jgi:hypothetical protein